MTTLHYLAYGSNLHPLRMLERVSSSRLLAAIPMPGRKLTFHKRSGDGSGKCNLVELGGTEEAYGALYEFDSGDKAALDDLEGLGKGYDQAQLRFSHSGVAYQPFVYIASRSHVKPSLVPYDWYKALVIAGARHLRFPEAYIAELESVASKPDLDASRRADREQLLVRIAAFEPIVRFGIP